MAYQKEINDSWSDLLTLTSVTAVASLNLFLDSSKEISPRFLAMKLIELCLHALQSVHCLWPSSGKPLYFFKNSMELEAGAVIRLI